MKISKTKLRQIIKEELSEADLPKWEGEPFGEYDLEAENEKGRTKHAHDLTKTAPPKALLKAASSLILDPMTSATIRKFVFDLVKGLDDEDFNDFEEALATAVDPQGEGPRKEPSWTRKKSPTRPGGRGHVDSPWELSPRKKKIKNNP